MDSAYTEHPFDIYIIGLGILSVRQVTREAEDALRTCTSVFVVDAGFGVPEYLASLGPSVVDMLPLYQRHGSRDLTYRRMAARVVEAALDAGPVAFATYGHPMMFSFPPFLIRRAAEVLGLRTCVLPGISSLDTMIVDLGFDPGTDGMQLYEATDVLIRERPLQPDVPLLLLQVAALETGLFSAERGNADRFRRLQDYLLRYYPPGHMVTMTLSSSFPLVGPLLESFPIENLAERLAKGSQSGTMFVPPTRRREVHDEQLFRDAYDTSHLKKITARRADAAR